MMLYNWNKFFLVELSCFGIELFKDHITYPMPINILAPFELCELWGLMKAVEMLDYVLGEFFIHLDCFIYIYTYIIIIDEYVCTYAIATFHLLNLADELNEVSEQTFAPP